MQQINITILYFAVFRERTQKSTEERTITKDTTVGELFEHIFQSADKSVRYAINEEFVPPNTPLEQGDVVAFIPPLGGG